jgi:Ca2+-binding RTX toxin-like protein
MNPAARHRSRRHRSLPPAGSGRRIPLRMMALGTTGLVTVALGAVAGQLSSTNALLTSTAAKQTSQIGAGTVALSASAQCAKTVDVSSHQTCTFPLSYTGTLSSDVRLRIAVSAGSVPLGPGAFDVTLAATGGPIPLVDGSTVDLGLVSPGWHDSLTVDAGVDATTMVLHAGANVTVDLTTTATSGTNGTGFSAGVTDSAVFTISDEAQIPPACQGETFGNIVVLTSGDDVWPPADTANRFTNHPNLVFGLGGDDVLHAGNSGDCLVGGAGNDKLYGGNAKDVLIGGAGDDYLDGGNGVDTLDGGGDASDVCDGGNGKDIVVECGGTQ